MLATLGLVATGIAVVHQRVQAGIGHSEDVTATATVTAVGAAEFLVLFMTERDAAVPAVTCGDVDKGFVNELRGVLSLKSEKPRRAGLLRWNGAWLKRPGSHSRCAC